MLVQQIAWDVDGVYADFNQAVKLLTGFDAALMHTDKSIRNKVWRQINAKPYEFWSSLVLIEDALKLYQLGMSRAHFFLTGLPGDSVGLGKKGKEDWLKFNFPVTDKQIHVVKRKDKALFAHKHALLVDDNEENCQMWEDAGGIVIHHKNVDDTYNELQILLAK